MSSRTLKYTLFTAILLAVMLVVTIVPVAAAKTDNQAKPVDGAAIDRMIEELEPFVTRCDDGTFRLDIPKDAKIDKASREFKAVSDGMAYVNSLIKEGTLVSTPDLSVYSANDSRFALQSNNRTEFKWRWYGFEIWLSHYWCVQLESGSLEAMAVVLECSLGIGAPLAVAIAGVIGVGALVVYLNDNGCGTSFYSMPLLKRASDGHYLDCCSPFAPGCSRIRGQKLACCLPTSVI